MSAVITARADLPKTGAVAPVQPERQTDKVETPKAEEAPKGEKISSEYANIARKERALRAQDQKLKEREAALAAKEASYQSDYIPKQQLAKRMSEDPMGVLNEFGLSYDQLVNLALNQPGPEAVVYKKLQAEIDALKNNQTETLTKIEQRQQEAYDQAVNQIRTDAKTLVDTDPAFETIKEMGSHEAIVELIKETHAKEGILLSVEQAAQQIEEYLIEEAMKMAGLKKVKERLTPKEVAQQIEVSARPPMKTLTNATGTTSNPRRSEKERVERAKLAFMGQLNQ